MLRSLFVALTVACTTPTSPGTATKIPTDPTSGVTTSARPTPAPSSTSTPTPGCTPHACADVGADCGSIDDGCGVTLDCGTCAAWSACGTVTANVCAAAACVPAEAATTDGGGRCADLNQAWTARGINVGYYPFVVLAETLQISGDFSGALTDPPFTAGPTSAGVILQRIPAGSYVGLSSSGPYYDPEPDCYPGPGCGDPAVFACVDSTPPLRPGLSGWYWGYAYSGASHMQGWIYADPAAIVYAGDDPAHPCALGPAGADYEVHEACGAPTSCTGANPTCGDVNGCSEGGDDCGATSCGAQSGGALTPSAHQGTVQLPAAHACTTKVPPDPSVLCLANGADPDFFYVYPHGAYLYWAQNSTTKHWLHYGDTVQSYFHSRDAQGVLWDFVEVLTSGAPTLTPPSDGAGAPATCTDTNPAACTPCLNGGTCGWVQDVFVQ